MTMTDHHSFCDAWLPAWTGNRPGHLLTFYAQDAYYRDPAKPAGLRGHGELLPYFQKLLAKNPNWVWRPLEIFPTEKGFTLKWEATIPVGKKIVVETGLDLVELSGGKIVRNEVYFDTRRLG